ncbi:MAG: hypothetical protein DRH57_06460 [Candidatus Cloacimonadota bacterium]|nr:MAG: hypothetical protein DRH57_06460 [Candidatus Cloacimonadota bacterium]
MPKNLKQEDAMTKKIIVIIFIIFLPIFTIAQVMDRIIAKVGDKIITQSELIQEIEKIKMANIMPTEAITQEKVLNKLIEDKLIEIKANREGITIDDAKIEQQLNQALDNIMSQFSSTAELNEALRQEGLTLEQVKENYRTEIKKNFIKEKLINTYIISKIVVSDDEISDYYKEHKDDFPARPEMMKIGVIKKDLTAGKEAESKALEKITKIRDELNNGASFAKLAEKYSECPSAKQGGDLGYFGKGTMVKQFEDTAFSLKLGEISEPVKTEFGYHLIKLEDRKDDQIRVRHILIKISPSEKEIEEKENLMQTIHQRLENGESFAELAIQYSDIDSAQANKGYLGEFPMDRIETLFSPEVKNLKQGEITNVINMDNSLYIFKNLGIVKERDYDYSEISNQLEELVKNEKAADKYEDWIAELKKEIYVENRLEHNK